MIGANAFGRRWRKAILILLAPSAWAASQKSSSRRDKNCPRTILAKPGLSEQRKAELFIDCFEEPLPEALKNFLFILSEQKRLILLPDISVLFKHYRADLERTVKLQVNTALALTEEQQKKLVEALTHKLERKIDLETSVDPSLIGGLVIRSGDMVIDASVRGKLAKMAKALGS